MPTPRSPGPTFDLDAAMLERTSRVLAGGAGLAVLLLVGAIGTAEILGSALGQPGWQLPTIPLAVFLGLVLPGLVVLWQAGRRRGLTARTAAPSLIVLSTVPTIIGVTTLWADPAHLPAAVHGLIPHGIACLTVFSAVLLRPRLSLGLAAWGAIQYLGIFALARPTVPEMVTDPALVESLAGWGEALRRATILIACGAATAFVGREFRSVMARMLTEERQREQAERDTLRAEVQGAMLEATSAAKSAFVAALCHELRTPTHGMLALGEQLAQAPELGLASRASAQTIVGSAHHLLDLIEESLDRAAVETGEVRVRTEQTSPGPLIEEVVGLLGSRLPADGPRLQLQVEPSVPTQVSTDPKRLRQVLFNLLGNALRHTPHGEVAVRAHTPEPGWLVLEVTDTGTGIPPALLPHVFTPHTQAPDPTRAGTGGLGLHITQRIVHALGGTITVDNRPEGGVRAQVRLPVASAPVPPRPLVPTFPKTADLTALRRSARRGDMRALATQLAAIRRDTPDIGPFCDRADAAVAAFDDETLLELLDEAPPSPAPPHEEAP